MLITDRNTSSVILFKTDENKKVVLASLIAESVSNSVMMKKRGVITISNE